MRRASAKRVHSLLTRRHRFAQRQWCDQGVSVDVSSVESVRIYLPRLNPPRTFCDLRRLLWGCLLDLHCAHSRHASAHGDVKPDNIMMDAHGWGRIIDWGSITPCAFTAAGGGNVDVDDTVSCVWQT